MSGRHSAYDRPWLHRKNIGQAKLEELIKGMTIYPTLVIINNPIRRGSTGKSEPLKKCPVSNSRITNRISLQRATPVGTRHVNCEQSFAAIDDRYNIRRRATGRSEHLKKCMVSNSRIRNCISLQRATPVVPRNANCERCFATSN